MTIHPLLPSSRNTASIVGPQMQSPPSTSCSTRATTVTWWSQSWGSLIVGLSFGAMDGAADDDDGPFGVVAAP